MANDSIWKRWEFMAIAFIVVVALVIAGGYAAYGALSTTHDPVESGLTVQIGDQISVDYVGMFEDGTVFDTSLQSVAENHTLYPKSLSFSSTAPFNPLSFTVGEGQTIQGFDNGVVGMGINQTRMLTIPTEEAYGYANEDLIETRSLTQTVPIYDWLTNYSAFQEIYQVEPIVGTTVESNAYGWNMTVFYIDPVSQHIMLKHNPMVGEIVSIDGNWNSKVISIDTNVNNGTGEIVIKHLLSSEDEGELSGIDQIGQFLITDVNLSEGTYTADYNKEVVGKTLVFKITVVSIIPA